MPPTIRFVNTSDGVRIAYSVHGSGPPLLYVRGWISHIEAMWTNPAFRAYMDALGERFTVYRYDTRGQGLSDRHVERIDVDSLALDVQALVERLNLNDPVLYGQAFGGPIAIAYAAANPLRVSKLVLDGTYARAHIRDREAQESFLHTLERFWPDSLSLIAQMTNPDPDGRVANDPPSVDWHERALTGEMAGRLYRLAGEYDVLDRLQSLTMPVLVMHRRMSRIKMHWAQEMAGSLPNADFFALDGSAANPWEGDAQECLDTIARFLDVDLRMPSVGRPSAPVAILFTDMEASTALTSRLGDVRAQDLVRTHDAVVRASVKSHAGAEVKHTGDGIMASFASISAALECAIAIQHGLREAEAPFRVKIGIDAGEPLREGRDITGTVVQSTRRIVDRAEPGQILVSDVVRRLVAGKDFEFVDRGRATLKGLPERVHLYEMPWEATTSR